MSTIDDSKVQSDYEVPKFAKKSTWQCAAEAYCIPCQYKLCPSGLLNGIKLAPNQRPETCPRAKVGKYDGLYGRKHRVLTLGDGDFSFSLSLARGAGGDYSHKGGLIATSHESLASIMATYPTAPNILAELKSLGVKVLHEIDATDLAASNALDKHTFDYVLWNFPCIRASGGADGQAAEIEENKTLVRLFFENVGYYLKEGQGEVHMTHKTFEPFSWWNIPKIAKDCGFKLQRMIVFDRCLYPGYINRKVLDKKSFPLHDARTFVFVPIDRPDDVCATDAVGDGLVRTDTPTSVQLLVEAVQHVLEIQIPQQQGASRLVAVAGTAAGAGAHGSGKKNKMVQTAAGDADAVTDKSFRESSSSTKPAVRGISSANTASAKVQTNKNTSSSSSSSRSNNHLPAAAVVGFLGKKRIFVDDDGAVGDEIEIAPTASTSSISDNNPDSNTTVSNSKVSANKKKKL